MSDAQRFMGDDMEFIEDEAAEIERRAKLDDEVEQALEREDEKDAVAHDEEP